MTMTMPSDERIIEVFAKHWIPGADTTEATIKAVRELIEQAEQTIAELTKQLEEAKAVISNGNYRSYLTEKKKREELEKQLSAQHPSPWVSVKERLPEPVKHGVSDEVIVWVKSESGSYRYYTRYSPEGDVWYGVLGDVTHWMPFPAPPTGKE